MTNSDLTKRRPSFSSQSSGNVVASIDSPPDRTSVFVKHGKYILVGAGGCWWVDLPTVLSRALHKEDGWIKRMMLAGLGLHVATIFIFLYLVLFIPWLRGYIPNYTKWQESARLRIIVPLLTMTILGSWTCLVISLSQAGKTTMFESVMDAVKGVGNASLGQMEGRDGMGVFSSMVGATSLFMFTLGILGMIPAPSHVLRKQD
ncbi:hypothetical protein J007_01378 [Cryptococcus neoformans]|nr:hypothetical protein C356_01382 [Cryptococcus neoformans var. grubii c45]OXB38933.1 hypothetical protein J007_01378 [Cryptococcus neoformans var. grubii]OXC63558.1 hypothetical protein C358_01381 [Cryptococcus neoformans var. grubii MW-RSA852]